MSVTRQSKIGDVVKEYPDTAPIMLSYGLHCVGCRVAAWETIEQGCRGHGMSEEMITELVEEINAFLDENGGGVKQ